MAFLIPLDAFDAALMSLPNLLWYLGHVNGPEEDFVGRCSSELPIVLPGDIHDSARLHKGVHWIFIDFGWVPHNNIGFITSRGDKSITFIPCRIDK
jgi:hypothetical protein